MLNCLDNAPCVEYRETMGRLLLDGTTVDAFLRRVGSSDNEDSRCEAVRDICLFAAREQASSLPRGSRERAAARAVTKEQEEDICRLVEKTQGEFRTQLVKLLGYVGGEDVVSTAARLTKRDLDEATLGTLIFALGQIGGPHARRLLSKLVESTASDRHRGWISGAIARIDSGGRVDFAEGLVESEAECSTSADTGSALRPVSIGSPSPEHVQGPETAYNMAPNGLGIAAKKWSSEEKSPPVKPS
jgi:hypothetical protein